MQRYTIAIDLDDTLYDFVGLLLTEYNKKYDDCIQKEDITDWDIHQFLKPECKSIFKEFATEELFEKCIIGKEVVNLMERLHSIANIYFVTSCAPRGLAWRARILKRHFSFYNDSMLVRLKDKSRFVCDYIIDDNPMNCIYRYNESICIAQPWNEEISCRTDIVDALINLILKIKEKEECYD